MDKRYPLPEYISLFVIGTGIAVLTGWALEIDILKSFLPGFIPMRINTACCFVLSGSALWLITSKPFPGRIILVSTFAVLIFLAGFLTFLGFILNIDFGIDLLIMGKKSLANPGGIYPGRMSAIPTINFMLTGIIFLLIALKPDNFRLYRALAFIILLISLFSLSVYLYHSATYVENPDFTSLALGTAVNFILLSSGIMLIHPNKGIIALLLGKGFTGIVVWQIIPFIFLIPLVLGIIWLEGLRSEWDLSESGTMLFALVFLLVLLIQVAGNIAYIMRAEKKFRVHEQSNYLASIVNYSDDAIISKSLDGVIRSWNKGAERIFGYSPSEIVGFPVTLLIPHDLLQEETDIITKIKNGDIVDHYETTRKRKDGSLIQVSLTISPLIDHTGTIIGASKIARDITERRKTEAELKKKSTYIEERISEMVNVLLKFSLMDFSAKVSVTDKGDELDAIAIGINSLYEELENYIRQVKENTEQIETIFKNAPDAIIVIDEEGKIVQWNPKAQSIFGWNSDEVSGKLLPELIIPLENREAYKSGIRNFVEKGEVSLLNRSLELPALRKNGTLFDSEMSISSSIINGKHFFIGIINDITERRQAEETRKRYIEQLAQNKELESFAYIVSHDLKTPIQGIAKIADWLIADYADRLDDTGKEYVRLLKQRTIRLEALINGILAYSRAGATAEEKTEIDFNVLVNDVKELIAVPDHVKCKLHPLPTLVTSKSAMTQVFGNLIGNAIKHNDKEIVELEIGATDENKAWKFFVKDNGPGIEKEYHEKAFAIFQTLRSKSNTDNTGIGLGIVKKIIEKEGGKVWIESEPGKGTTFFFTILK